MILLGKTVEVTNSTNPSLVGLHGVVIADDQNTLRIDTQHGEKLVVKSTVTLKIDGFICEGKSLVGTHAMRTKRNK